MTLARFTNYVDGWNKAHGADDQLAAPSEEEFEQWKEAVDGNG